LEASADLFDTHRGQGADPGGKGAIAPPKTYESNFIPHDFAQFRKQHSLMILDYQILLKSPPPKLTGWIRPCWGRSEEKRQFFICFRREKECCVSHYLWDKYFKENVMINKA